MTHPLFFSLACLFIFSMCFLFFHLCQMTGMLGAEAAGGGGCYLEFIKMAIFCLFSNIFFKAHKSLWFRVLESRLKKFNRIFGLNIQILSFEFWNSGLLWILQKQLRSELKIIVFLPKSYSKITFFWFRKRPLACCCFQRSTKNVQIVIHEIFDWI